MKYVIIFLNIQVHLGFVDDFTSILTDECTSMDRIPSTETPSTVPSPENLKVQSDAPLCDPVSTVFRTLTTRRALVKYRSVPHKQS
jgi:hypothetical protein